MLQFWRDCRAIFFDYADTIYVIDDAGTLLSMVPMSRLLAAAPTMVGLLFPWILFRLWKDPAFGSGPIATITQDVLSLMVYFFTVSLLAQ